MNANRAGPRPTLNPERARKSWCKESSVLAKFFLSAPTASPTEAPPQGGLAQTVLRLEIQIAKRDSVHRHATPIDSGSTLSTTSLVAFYNSYLFFSLRHLLKPLLWRDVLITFLHQPDVDSGGKESRISGARMHAVPPVPAAPAVDGQPLQPNVPTESQEETPPAYLIIGGDDGGNQILQFHLAAGQKVRSASPINFLYASAGINLNRRRRDGDSFFFFTDPDEIYQSDGSEPLGFLGLAAPHAGKILPIKVEGRMALLLQNESYLASTGSVSHRRMCLQAGVNTEQLFMTRVVASPSSARGATVFLHAPGSIVETNLGVGQKMYVSISAIVAVTEGVTVNLSSTGAQARPLSGAEWARKSQSICLVQGPGTVYVSSLPVARQVRRLLSASRPENLPLLPLLRIFLMVLLFAASLAVLHSLNMLAFDGQEF